MGAWIEILHKSMKSLPLHVAPLVGAWIEIIAKLYKYVPIFVAPLVGAWIEMSLYLNVSTQVY